MFRNKKVLWILLIVLVLSGGGYYAYARNAQSATAADQPPVQTAVARRGDLVLFASAAGQIIAPDELSLGFDQSGTLSELLVQVGEEVKAGQVLARLQTDSTEASIAAEQANANLAVLTAQKDLDDIYANHQMDVAQALQAADDAQTALDDLLNPESEAATALQNLVTALDNLARGEDQGEQTDTEKPGAAGLRPRQRPDH